jgi:hypothetical protein
MKLVRKSLQSGPADVLIFLLEEAKKWGVIIEVRRSLKLVDDEEKSGRRFLL